jgi:hypothetical protein
LSSSTGPLLFWSRPDNLSGYCTLGGVWLHLHQPPIAGVAVVNRILGTGHGLTAAIETRIWSRRVC